MTEEIKRELSTEAVLTPREQIMLVHFDGMTERSIAMVWAQMIHNGNEPLDFPLEEYLKSVQKLEDCHLVERMRIEPTTTVRITHQGRALMKEITKDKERFKKDLPVSSI